MQFYEIFLDDEINFENRKIIFWKRAAYILDPYFIMYNDYTQSAVTFTTNSCRENIPSVRLLF